VMVMVIVTAMVQSSMTRISNRPADAILGKRRKHLCCLPESDLLS